MGLGDYLKPIVSVATASLGWQIAGPIGGAIGWGLGMGIGGALFPPEAEKTTAQSLGPAQALKPQANYGGVVPVVYGSRRIAGNIIWYTNNITATPANVGDWEAFAATATRYGYTGTFFAATFANAVCIGPATVTRIYNGKDEYICDGSRAYRINVGDNVPVEYINKTPEEVLDKVIQAGTPYDFSYTEYRGDQTVADTTIVAAQGASSTPPYRNLCYLVIHDFPVKDLNSDIPSFTFEVSSVVGVENPTPEYSSHVHVPTNEVAYYFGSFAYKGFVYVLDSEATDGYYLLSTMKKYTQDLSTLVATYNFEKRYLSGPRGHTSSYYAPQFNISVDEHNGRVLVIAACGILIDMDTLSEGGTNYYKVFSDTSEFATYMSGGTIYYACREGASGYSGDDHTKYISLSDQYLSNTPASSNPGLTPLGSMRGLLVPSTTYFLSPSHYGFKKQSVSDGAITEYITPTGTARGYTPAENWGDGPYWDHTWVEQFIFGDDGFVYVALHIVYGRSYFGLFDPLGKYDILLLRYSVGPDGELTEAARRLYSDMTTLTVLGRIDGWPIYTITHLSLNVSKGFVYLTFKQSTGPVHLIKLNTADLSVVIVSTGPHYTGSMPMNAGSLCIFKQRYGVDKLVYYCEQEHVHILDTSFVDDETAITIYEPGVYSFGEGGGAYTTGMRGDGYTIFPGWDGGATIFKYMDFDPEYTRLVDVVPQDVSADILTNEFYGEGLAPSILEITMTAEAEQYAIDNDLLISLVFDQQRAVLESLSYVAGHHNGFFTTDGGIAHRQLEIDDEDTLWVNSSALSDAFGDEATGSQWNVIGGIPSAYINMFINATQSIRINELPFIFRNLNALLVERTKINESITIDVGYRNINRSESMRITENRTVEFSDKYINAVDILAIEQGDTWNADDKSATMVLSNRRVTATTSSSSGAQAVRSIGSRSGSRKYYFEMCLTVWNGSASVHIGVDDGTTSLTGRPGYSANSWGFNGPYFTHNSTETQSPWYGGGGFAQGKYVRIALDLDNNKLWFGLNGVWSGNPAAGTGEAHSGLHATKYYAMISTAVSNGITANFGQSPFAYPVPEGFTAWSATGAEIENEKYINTVQPIKTGEIATKTFA